MIGNATNPGLVDLTGSAESVVILTGYYSAGDGGGGVFVWSTSLAFHDGGAIVNPYQGGAPNPAAAEGWRRLYSGPINVKWFGARGDGLTDDYEPFQRALDSLLRTPVVSPAGSTVPHGGRELYLPRGDYLTTRTLKVNVHGVRIIGEGGAGAPFLARILWDGVIDSTGTNDEIMRVAVTLFEMERVFFTVKPGRSCRIGLNWVSANDTNVTGLHLTKCLFSVDARAGQGTMEYGLLLGYDTSNRENQDFAVLTEVGFINMSFACVRVANNANSLGHVFHACGFANYLAQGAGRHAPATPGEYGAPYGIGVISEVGGPMTFRNCNFSYLERGIVTRGAYPAFTLIEATDSEGCKRLWDDSGLEFNFGNAYSGNTVTITGGRFGTENAGAPSFGPHNLPASDRAYIRRALNGPLNLIGCSFTSSRGLADVGIIEGAHGAAINAYGCSFPNMDPIKARQGDFVKVVSLGNYGASGSAAQELPDGFYKIGAVGSPKPTYIDHVATCGISEQDSYAVVRTGMPTPVGLARNMKGSFSVVGASTSAIVYFPTGQPDTNYEIFLSRTGKTGTPNLGSTEYTITKNQVGFTVNFDSAPGINPSTGVAHGNVFAWFILR